MYNYTYYYPSMLLPTKLQYNICVKNIQVKLVNSSELVDLESEYLNEGIPIIHF
jgi:hypothetical protein